MPQLVVGTLLLLLLSASLFIGALVMRRRDLTEIESRVTLVAPAESRTTSIVDKRLGWLKTRLPHFDTQVRRMFTAGSGHHWGMKAGTLQLAVLAIATGVSVWFLAQAVFGLSWWLAAAMTGLSAFIIPRTLLLRQQKKAELLFGEMFPDTVDFIARALRAGLPISSAVRAVSAESQPPIRTVFATVANQMEIGVSLQEALDASSQKVGLADFRFFSTAVVLQDATGGNLTVTLEVLSDIIRRRRALRLKTKAITAEIRVSAYVVGSLPFLMIGALFVIQPGYLTPLFVDPRGHFVLAMAVGGLLLAAISIRQMMRSVTNM